LSPPLDRSRVVFGCGNFGGLGSSPTLRDKGDDRTRAFALLDHAREIGLTRFDTANTYGGGLSETILGEWLTGQGPAYRQTVEVATKVGNPHGCPPADRPLSAAQIAHHLDASLGRLRIERIDLYYIHEFEDGTPLDESLEALDRALAHGTIAKFGVSNASAAQLGAVLTLAPARLRAAFTTVQNGFNLLETRDRADVIPLCQAEGLDYVAFSPLAGGLLTGKYHRGAAALEGRMNDAPGFFEALLTDETFALIDDLRIRASETGATVASLALRDLLDIPGVAALIIAPRSSEQFDAYGLRP
jgi:aryl-alcohol dehydrogenase-like predicted oxidoreductase